MQKCRKPYRLSQLLGRTLTLLLLIEGTMQHILYRRRSCPSRCGCMIHLVAVVTLCWFPVSPHFSVVSGWWVLVRSGGDLSRKGWEVVESLVFGRVTGWELYDCSVGPNVGGLDSPGSNKLSLSVSFGCIQSVHHTSQNCNAKWHWLRTTPKQQSPECITNILEDGERDCSLLTRRPGPLTASPPSLDGRV